MNRSRRQQISKKFGVPGAGKTTTLLNLVEFELESGLPPERVAYLTFTRVARQEATERAIKKFGFNKDQLRNFATIHSIAYRSLGYNRSMALTTLEQLRRFGDQFGFRFGFEVEKDAMNEDQIFAPMGEKNGDKFLAFYHWMQHKMYDFETAYKRWPDNLDYWQILQFCKAYQKYKRKEGLHDYTDFLIEYEEPMDVDVVFVDEAQDLSNLQWSTLWKMAERAKRIYIAGDDDQAIFAWAGAAPDVFIDTPGRTDVLSKSYRMPRAVFDLSQTLVRKISKRQNKVFEPRDEQGAVLFHQAFADVPIFAPLEPYTGAPGQRMPYRVLVRNNYLKDAIIDDLKMRGVVFSDTGRESIPPATVDAVKAWADLQKGHRITISRAADVFDLMTTNLKVKKGAKARVKDAASNEPERMVSLRDLQESFGLLAGNEPWQDAFTRLTAEESYYIRTLIRHGGMKALGQKPWLDVSTIHGAKGAEADNVILITEMSARCRKNFTDDPDSERRVWYTGITRAAENLHIVGNCDELF